MIHIVVISNLTNAIWSFKMIHIVVISNLTNAIWNFKMIHIVVISIITYCLLLDDFLNYQVQICYRYVATLGSETFAYRNFRDFR